MRVTREQAAANRERILDVAGTLFRQHGYDGIGVADIMKRAGLTHGGFYGHFESKDDLAAEITARLLNRPGWPQRLTGVDDPSLDDIVGAYLAPVHRDDAGKGCIFAALAADVVRQPKSVRHAFTEGLRRRIETLATLMPGRAKRRERALTTLASLVGAMILARAVDDPKFSDEILSATKGALLK